MRDPVLERNMFRKEDTAPPSDGVVSLVNGESDYDRRKRLAAEMIAVAKERQNPENYKTLSEQSRPGVFRPVATGQPQAPQPNTQQQMAQMQAMGFRPVGMADGGYVQRFAEGSGPAGVVPFIPDPTNLQPGIRMPNDSGMGSIPRLNLPTEKPADTLTGTESSKDILLEAFPDLATATEEDIDRMAREERDRVLRVRGKSPVGRGIQSILTRDELDLDVIKSQLRSRRDQVREAEAVKKTPITSPLSFETASAADIEAQKQIRAEALLRARGLPTEADREATRARMLGESRGAFSATGEPPKEEPSPAPTTEPKPVVEPKKGIETLGEAGKPTDMEAIKAARMAAARDSARSEDINMALLQAGLAMAAGESPNALKNIAAGGISGLQAYAGMQKDRRATDLEERKMAMQEQYYKDRAEREQATIDRASDRNKIALMNLRRQAQDSAAREFKTLLDADPTLKMDAKRRDVVMDQLTQKYLRSLMIDSSLGMSNTGVGEVPDLNENAPSLLD